MMNVCVCVCCIQSWDAVSSSSAGQLGYRTLYILRSFLSERVFMSTVRHGRFMHVSVSTIDLVTDSVTHRSRR